MPSSFYVDVVYTLIKRCLRQQSVFSTGHGGFQSCDYRIEVRKCIFLNRNKIWLFLVKLLRKNSFKERNSIRNLDNETMKISRK